MTVYALFTAEHSDVTLLGVFSDRLLADLCLTEVKSDWPEEYDEEYGISSLYIEEYELDRLVKWYTPKQESTTTKSCADTKPG